MRRDEALTILAAHREELQQLGVSSLSLFGSVARDEATPESDVDILVEVRRPFGLLALSRLHRYLEAVLGRSVDLVTRNGLHPKLRDRILSEAIRAA